MHPTTPDELRALLDTALDMLMAESEREYMMERLDDAMADDREEWPW
jgi:hypothetical protein